MTVPVNADFASPREEFLILQAQRDARELARQAPELVRRLAEDATIGFLPAGALPDYEIKEEIHRGGQGVVYRAVHVPAGNAVAIKIMRGGALARPEERLRFAREIQILEQLRHPGIVAVRANGIVGDSHYFVMDYVPGQPLDRWILDFGIWILDWKRPEAGLSVERSESKIQIPKSKIETVLRLFAEICDAVNTAHLRGVIHRDLKPSNILVVEEGIQGLRDSGIKEKQSTPAALIPQSLSPAIPHPKILDFGLAKLTPEASLVGPHAMTRTGHFVGSLPWASPEQAAANIAALDLRTDVYSLGVVFYQMLTGRFPYQTNGNMADVVKNILRAEPVRPRALRPEIGDELETILLKCLNKEPERRYQTAGELARDLRHLLAGEPIEAKRNSGWYMLRKTLHRYRGATTAAVALALVIMIGLVATTLLWQRTMQERNRAMAAEILARQARLEAEKQRELVEVSAAQARQEAAKAAAVNQFLQDMLATADPAISRGRDVPVLREMLDAAAQKIEQGALQNDPQVQASVRGTLGNTYRDLGQLAAAEAQLREALALRRKTLGDDHPEVAANLSDLAMVLYQKGDFTAAEPLFREALAIHRRTLGDKHPRMAQSLSNLAQVLHAMGRLAEAEALLREALACNQQLFGAKHPAVATALTRLGNILRKRGAAAEAEPIFREALAIQRELLGADHPDTLASMEGLGQVLQDRGDFAGAEAIFRETLATRRKVFGPEHPAVGDSLSSLALLYQKMGRFTEATAMLREVLAISRKTLGNEHPQIAAILAQQAALLLETGEPDAAEALCREALQAQRKILGEEHPQVLQTMGLLGKILTQRQQFDAGEALLLQAYQATNKQFGEQAPGTVQSIKNLIGLYEAWGKTEQAAAWRAKLEAPSKK